MPVNGVTVSAGGLIMEHTVEEQASPAAVEARRVIEETGAEVIKRMLYPPVQFKSGLRIRVNISRSTKGVVTHDHTIEGDDRDRVLAESDRVYKELDTRYPFNG
jgi:hypothetical protein